MKIVIELTDEQWECVKNGTWCGSKEILDGIPLPKGHGRLIDAAVLRRKMGNLAGFDLLGRCIDEEPTIIEADGGDSE